MTKYFALILIIIATLTTRAMSDGDTAITYQGRLLDAGEAANGTFNLDFTLFDALSGGNQVGSTIVMNGVQVTDGLFAVELDFGANAFDNESRWLEIVVEGVTLSPRQPINRAPYSIQTRGIFVDENNNVGIGTSTPGYSLHVESNGTSIFGRSTASTGFAYGVSGLSNSTSGIGIRGGAIASTGITYGLYGTSNSTDGIGVYGAANVNTGTTYGVYGSSLSSSGRGVYGEATANSGITYGGRFESDSTSGRGVLGIAIADSGTTYGGRFENYSTSGRGVFGYASVSHGTTYGGYFRSASSSGHGVFGIASASSGINYGGWFESNSTSGRALFGLADANSGTNYGVVGHSNSSSGFDFWASGAGTNYGSPSSRRFKSNVVPIGDPLDKLARLQGVYFDWDDEHGGQHDVGMIAEEVGEVLPEIVNYEENGIDAIGMDYSKMTPLLVEAVNALRAEKDTEIVSLESEVAQLRHQNANLESRLAQLEALMTELVAQKGIK